ncbi:Werner Syndrome-like exonuclease [Anoplophora glabripennis]|uniref:Werner Syndrome-like exonuclease n=1 Tax=Anoplophora glabripennis TaxID=217634 RepID=UPI0008752B1E|nr:Werner Syndrome-like exonuclease [Anoplophora glabripennis]
MYEMEFDISYLTSSRLRPRLTSAEKEEQAKRTELEKQQLQADFENRPFIQFNGNLKYHADLIDCALICDNLLEAANKSKDVMVLGFDMEWPFSFKTGSGRTAVIQISPDLNVCYILHVSQLKNLPRSLNELLIHPNIRLAGNNVKNDVRKLARDYVGFDSDRLIENCIDIGVFANSVLPVTQRWSLEKLVDYVLQMRIDKNKKVRMSKWHKFPLSVDQQKYAAIDAYASLLLYLTLKEKKLYSTATR